MYLDPFIVEDHMRDVGYNDGFRKFIIVVADGQVQVVLARAVILAAGQVEPVGCVNQQLLLITIVQGIEGIL